MSQVGDTVAMPPQQPHFAKKRHSTIERKSATHSYVFGRELAAEGASLLVTQISGHVPGTQSVSTGIHYIGQGLARMAE